MDAGFLAAFNLDFEVSGRRWGRPIAAPERCLLSGPNVTANDLVDPVWSVAAGSERRIRGLAVISGCGGK